MKKKLTLILMLAICKIAYATNGGLDTKETVVTPPEKFLKQKMCFSNDKEFSLGAVLRKTAVDLRCTMVYLNGAEDEATAAWVPLSNSLKALR